MNSSIEEKRSAIEKKIIRANNKKNTNLSIEEKRSADEKKW